MKWYQDSDGNTSGKRIFGAVTMAIYLIAGLFVIGYSIYSGNDIGDNAVSVLNGFGLAGASMLGIGVVEKLGAKKEIVG